MNKEIKFEVIKDKVFKKDVDNLILMIETAVIARPDNVEKLEQDIKFKTEVVGALTPMKEISIDNTYANQIITIAETELVKAENKLNTYLLDAVAYDNFQNQVIENYTENHTGHRKYNVDFFKNVIELAKMFGLTDEFTKEQEEVRQALLKKQKDKIEKEKLENEESNSIS